MSIFIKNTVFRLATKTLTFQQVRFNPRWNHRRPVKVFTAEEYNNVTDGKPEEKPSYIQDNVQESEPVCYDLQQSDEQIKPLKVVKKVANVIKPKKPTDMLEMVFNSDGDYVYTKMKNNDTRISNLMVELKSGKEQVKTDMILLEGKRLIRDALESNCRLKYLLFSRTKEVDYLKPYLPKSGAKLYKMPYKEIQMWSNLTTSPGIVGIFQTPDTTNYQAENSIPLTIICDNVREPGNLGAVLRTCAGVGCQRVILTKGCVNLWESKVLRSSCGCHFHLQIHAKKSWKEIKEMVGPKADVFVADNKIVSATSDDTNLKEMLNTILLLPYYGIDYTNCNHIVLIVGGETEGISEESYKYALESRGSRLNVPLTNNVDSLNTGTALGVIVFEIKRQLSIMQAKQNKAELNTS